MHFAPAAPLAREMLKDAWAEFTLRWQPGKTNQNLKSSCRSRLSSNPMAPPGNSRGISKAPNSSSKRRPISSRQQLTCAATCPLWEESIRSLARVRLTATTVHSAMIQRASLLACTGTLTTGNAAPVRPFSTISPSHGSIARSRRTLEPQALPQLFLKQLALCFSR